MKAVFFILVFAGASAVTPQSFDLKTEREKLAKIEAAIKAGDDPTFVAECDALLDPHRINALAWYTCGKHLLYVKTTDPKQARANVKQAYGRLKIAADDFFRTGKQLYYALDAMQYLGLAAMLLGDHDRAQVHFRLVISRDNRIPAAWYNLGVIYELKGLKEESMRAFDRYLRLTSGTDGQDF
jgi:tetratricopeptide (TPR) repeat protein